MQALHLHHWGSVRVRGAKVLAGDLEGLIGEGGWDIKVGPLRSDSSAPTGKFHPFW